MGGVCELDRCRLHHGMSRAERQSEREEWVIGVLLNIPSYILKGKEQRGDGRKLGGREGACNFDINVT